MVANPPPDGRAWIPAETGGEVVGELQKAQKLLREAYECIQRLERLIFSSR
jgi:hypothetical protein